MDRIFQWAWDRYGPRYWWAFLTISFTVLLPTNLVLSFCIVSLEGSDKHVEAAIVTVMAVLALVYVWVLPGVGHIRLMERWAAGKTTERAEVLRATYTWGREAVARAVVSGALIVALLAAFVGVIAGADGSRLVQYSILGATIGIAIALIGVHSFAEAAMRPARLHLAGASEIGDALPRTRPSFAAWSSISMIAAMFAFTVGGALVSAAVDHVQEAPVLAFLIAGAFTLLSAAPATVGAVFVPSLRPIRDLAEGTKRVAAGDYGQRLPVVQDDDLGALAASFNRMQAGLAERQRLQSAFGTYVDPSLAARLLEQGDDVFTGERREVTVMFVDIRDFTPFAEASPAEDIVARLNALFEIVVPAVVDAGGHVNKFLGDGALAVFGAPNDLANHADAAVTAAVLIHRLVTDRFAGDLRIGIGINTGVVIAGTIGGGSKLEFTLIGDTVNVAARVEQLTKTTGDPILLTSQTVDGLDRRPFGLLDRGAHALKGKSARTQVFGLDSTMNRLG
ncbi:adenylate/guanylate cyclase domain-containing protein [Mycobacterium lehmannii]|uniref:adenylate/guanylate cyclase domain-containing protein n=1 Tax=Mycobacterium lehmannii TaxID=2048550 RepID=UPI00082A0FE9|nr:adenylate/guanylate cyclase domain-containing protein [Mycobacterium lehmannii]